MRFQEGDRGPRRAALAECKFYPVARELSTVEWQYIRDLTTPSAARSNTALFPSEQTHEANLPTFEDAARAASRVSRAQPDARRSRRIACAARQGPQASRGLAVAQRVHGRAKPARFGLGASRRLVQSTDFERLLREGRRESLAGFTFFQARRMLGPPRLGILISRKHAARASERNSIKRCIREAFRLEQEGLGALDVLVRPAYGCKPGAAMIVRLRRLFAKLAR